MRVFLVSVAIVVSLPIAARERRGGIAFHYATPLTAAQLEWFSRFEVLVTHDPLPRAQVDALHRSGTKLVLYEWAVAYYASLATPAHRALPALNRTPLRGHLGSNDADAYYYDPASNEHARGRADSIAKRLAAIHYDGVFLDTTTAASVHPDALREYQRRHPGTPYDEAYALFLRNLSKTIDVIVTNQGYRRPDDVLPYADWDISESLFTYPKNGKYVLRPWNDPHDRWNSIRVLMRELIAPAARKYPRVRFAHINYVPDVSYVPSVLGLARLFGMDAFAATPSLEVPLIADDYFFDFGKARPRVETRHGASRRFEHGFIAFDKGKVTVRRDP